MRTDEQEKTDQTTGKEKSRFKHLYCERCMEKCEVGSPLFSLCGIKKVFRASPQWNAKPYNWWHRRKVPFCVVCMDIAKVRKSCEKCG